MTSSLTAFVLSAITTVPQAAEAAHCEGRPEIAGACFTVHGRLSHWNGNPTLRIWKIGTNRILGVREGYPLPQSIRGCVGDGQLHNVYGDFLVCPLAGERSGHMRPVCVETAKHLVLERFKSLTSLEPIAARRLPPGGCAAE